VAVTVVASVWVIGAREKTMRDGGLYQWIDRRAVEN
jgi:hypothetical protein